MNGLVKFVIAAVGGLGAGLVSAQMLIDGSGDLFSTRDGPWTSWPTAGTRSSNPYVRGHYLTHDRLPISQFEINELEARVDDDGAGLDGNCAYTISGKAPKARWWSIYSFSESNSNLDAFPKRVGINSQQLFFQTDGSYSINLSRTPKTGNWLIPANSGSFVLVLRHYNPGRSIANQFKFDNLPSIKKGECR